MTIKKVTANYLLAKGSWDVNPLYRKQKAIRNTMLKSVMEKNIAVELTDAEKPSYFLIFSPSAKNNGRGRYQLTFFDSKGAISDVQRDTIVEIIKEIPNNTYTITDKMEAA